MPAAPRPRPCSSASARRSKRKTPKQGAAAKAPQRFSLKPLRALDRAKWITFRAETLFRISSSADAVPAAQLPGNPIQANCSHSHFFTSEVKMRPMVTSASSYVFLSALYVNELIATDCIITGAQGLFRSACFHLRRNCYRFKELVCFHTWMIACTTLEQAPPAASNVR